MEVNISHVNPGDLITSLYVNSIADGINSLQAQIDALGTGPGPGPGPGPAAPEITSVSPSPVVANAVMNIHGKNFLVPAEANTISLSGTTLADFAAGSTDTQINVMVPGTIVTEQTTMLLSVSANGIAETTVTVAPPTVVYGGQIVVKDASGSLGKPKVGDTIPFQFSLDGSELIRADDFHIRAEFNNALPVATPTSAWDSGTAYTGTSGTDHTVTVDPTLPAPTVGVNVTVPTGAKSADMIVRAVSVHNDPASSNTSKTIPIVVGVDQPQGDAHITADFGFTSNSILQKITYNSGSFIGNGLGIKFGATPLVTMKVGVDQADHAGTYKIEGAVENPDTSVWQVKMLPITVSVAAGQTTDVFFQLQLVPTSVTPAGSELRYFTLTATRQETTGPGQVSNYLRFPIGGF